ncbi:efflux RND transporter periplasmic adaptor subunit [Flammeovirga kamogawensis]|uniref:Efflux RND transporter periplasmic adaptor subunit n=1 Tax=Flammeovirga kamogawensis TaxID=373891 RepID=A0ABX8H2B6_9BACT|nr:efflux RND transporter periplasmic adaptor subunit [Flammeovirga kamogawensis]MBB6460233.1 RND family efflux transporter MFP subunit [Flammeovirga kamogawensis]QWG10045.1 efflux RND transporter periplasmic adaptor subunit [Flammeovirga kamogawensis]TRX65552.1 efflux RND transporter periplasmic adaptor subunit [Flammeovirga kamogawensis]
MRLSNFIILSIFFISCSTKNKVETEHKDQLVKIVQVDAGNSSDIKIVTGVTSPNKEVNMSFRVSGPLVNFNLEEGQKVIKGEFLGAIDTRDFKLALQKAEANYRLAKTENERASRLHKSNNVSLQVLDKAKLAFEEAQTNLTTAKNALNDTKLFAPFTGYIKSVHTEKGEHVNATQRILVLQDFSKVKVKCNVPEAIVLNAKNIDRIHVVFDSKPTQRFSAEVLEILHDTEGINYAYPMILELNQENEDIIAGMTADIYLTLSTTKSTTSLLPTNAVMGKPNGDSFVWGIHPETQTLKKVPVSIKGLKNDDKFIVEIQDDIEWVVATGGTYLVEGQKVRVKLDNTIVSLN